MSKEIPEDVYNSVETLAEYCESHSICKNCILNSGLLNGQIL